MIANGEETSGQILAKQIEKLIAEQQYEVIKTLFLDNANKDEHLTLLQEVGVDLLHDVCCQHLTEQTHNTRPALYSCAEELLKVIAGQAPAEGILLELLEMIEEAKGEHVFTSVLHAMQVVLLRLSDRKPQALEWCLNSVHDRLLELPVPEYLNSGGYDLQQEQLLEQNEQVQNLLIHHITVGLFYEPLLQDITTTTPTPPNIFRPRGLTRRNILCCFLVQLLGPPLATLDVTLHDGRRTNTHTAQCARGLATAVTRCIIDPFYFLELVELRQRRIATAHDQQASELSDANIFLWPEKLPLNALAMYIYMLVVEEVGLAVALPRVYHPLFVFEATLYLAVELLRQEHAAMQYRGILLVKRLVQNLAAGGQRVPAASLELAVHQQFCQTLCNIISYGNHTHLRQQGVILLRQYILQFDDEGRYCVLHNLFSAITHRALAGYLASLYKDLVAEALAVRTTLPAVYSGRCFRRLFLQFICNLPHGATTDLVEHADLVIAALNAIRFCALQDSANLTGFWHIAPAIELDYLTPLRHGLDLAVAHFKAELATVEHGSAPAGEREELAMMDVNIANVGDAGPTSRVPEMDRECKVELLNTNLCTFDLIHSLLARVTECLAAGSARRTGELLPPQ